MNSALALQNLDREPLGFILFHLDPEPAGDGYCEGDCVFQILPAKAELFESALVRSLYRYHFRESGEHRVRLTKSAGAYSYQIIPGSEAPLTIELSASGEGQLLCDSNLIAYVVAAVRE